MSKRFHFVLMTVALVGLSIFSSCKKDDPTIAKIIVMDNENKPISGASVELSVVPTTPENGGAEVPGKSIWEEGGPENTTDSNGITTFDLSKIYKKGQAGVLVANVKATYDGKIGEGIIKVEEKTTSTETVFISL